MTPEPCGICQSPVREVRVPGERSIADTGAPMIIRRVCTNPECPSRNPREMSVADVV